MSQVVGLKFNNYRPVLFYRAAPYQLQKGEHVLIKAEEGVSSVDRKTSCRERV